MTGVEEEPAGSPAAGACVLVVLGGGAAAAVFAVSPTAGVLALWGAGTFALWRAVRRSPVSDMPAPPPPEGAPPSRRKPPGQLNARGFRRVEREGMLIFFDDTEDRHTTL